MRVGVHVNKLKLNVAVLKVPKIKHSKKRIELIKTWTEFHWALRQLQAIRLSTEKYLNQKLIILRCLKIYETYKHTEARN